MKKIKISKATSKDLRNSDIEFIWEHGKAVEIPLEQVVPNDWNFNEMSPEEFNMLAGNVSDVGFLDPILVVPMKREKNKVQMFMVIDGEHRYEQQRIDDPETIQCIVVDPDKMDEKEQMRQTARMNKIKGHTNKEKFRKFVDKMISEHDIPVDEIAYELGYVDQSEFDSLLEKARGSLPSPEAKKEFDSVKDEIKTVDDLTNLLNKLFTKYGGTLKYNFMMIDFGGKESIWIRMKREDFKTIVNSAKECQREDAAFDSLLVQLFKQINISKFIKKFRDKVEKPKEDSLFDIDGLIDGEDD